VGYPPDLSEISMTLEDLDNTSPEGLHDAQIRAYRRDFELATLTLFVKLVVGVSEENKHRLQYRDGEIKFHGVQYVVSDFPGVESTFRDVGCVWFSFNRTEPGVIPEAIDNVLSPNILKYSLFILDWHSSIHIAAREISFTWSS
jgi:hypothetical protein